MLNVNFVELLPPGDRGRVPPRLLQTIADFKARDAAIEAEVARTTKDPRLQRGLVTERRQTLEAEFRSALTTLQESTRQDTAASFTQKIGETRRAAQMRSEGDVTLADLRRQLAFARALSLITGESDVDALVADVKDALATADPDHARAVSRLALRQLAALDRADPRRDQLGVPTAAAAASGTVRQLVDGSALLAKPVDRIAAIESQRADALTFIDSVFDKATRLVGPAPQGADRPERTTATANA